MIHKAQCSHKNLLKPSKEQRQGQESERLVSCSKTAWHLLSSVMKLDEKQKKKNERVRDKGSFMVDVAPLLSRNLLVPLVNNEAPSMTDPLTDRPSGRGPSLFITRHRPCSSRTGHVSHFLPLNSHSHLSQPHTISITQPHT